MYVYMYMYICTCIQLPNHLSTTAVYDLLRIQYSDSYIAVFSSEVYAIAKLKLTMQCCVRSYRIQLYSCAY